MEKDSISEEMVSRYYELTEKQKEIEHELRQLKQFFHRHFDRTIGPGKKGELRVGNFQVQRQIRENVHYEQEKTVQKLEKLKLEDCIDIIKKPNPEKISAARQLDLLDEDALSDCLVRKTTRAIIVKKEI